MLVPFFCLHLVQQGVQPQEVPLPISVVLLEPLVGFGERLAVNPADVITPDDAAPHQLRPLQHFDVLGRRRERHLQRRRQFAEILFPRGQAPQDGPPRRMGQGVKDAIQFR